MKTMTYTNNRLELTGRITRITEYSPGKAAEWRPGALAHYECISS